MPKRGAFLDQSIDVAVRSAAGAKVARLITAAITFGLIAFNLGPVIAAIWLPLVAVGELLTSVSLLPFRHRAVLTRLERLNCLVASGVLTLAWSDQLGLPRLS